VLVLKKYIGDCLEEHDKLREQLAVNKQREDFLYGYHTDLPEADFQLAYHAYEWPKKMMSVLKESTDKAAAEHKEFEDSLKRRRKGFDKQLTDYQAEITAFESIGEKDLKVLYADGDASSVRRPQEASGSSNRDKFAQQTLDLSQKLKDAQVEADEINYQEGLFGWPKTKFSHVAHMVAALEPFLNLWTIVSNFSTNSTKWMSGPFANLDPEKIEGDVGEMFRKIFKLTKVFGGAGSNTEMPEPLKVAESTMEKIKAFQKYQPLITAICNAGLRDRHWAAMSEAVGFELKRDDHTSLDRLLGRRVVKVRGRVRVLARVGCRGGSW
jgi:dynein heavy chain